jgi:hypothetical protein
MDMKKNPQLFPLPVTQWQGFSSQPNANKGNHQPVIQLLQANSGIA